MSCPLPMLVWPDGIPYSSGKIGRRKGAVPRNPVLCSLLASSSSRPRPGDVYKPQAGSSGPVLRPLGLIPHRRRDGEWRELTLMLSSFSTTNEQDELSLPEEEGRSEHHSEEIPSNGIRECRAVVITQKGSKVPRRKLKMAEGRREVDDSHPVFSRKKIQDVDLDYLDLLANGSLLRTYPSMNETCAGNGGVDPLVPPVPGTDSKVLRHSNVCLGNRAHTKPTQDKIRSPWKFLTNDREYEYLSFTLPAHLSTRLQHTDLRDAQDYEPCERCRLRGTRCSRCKAIRTGGGYIILGDGNEDEEGGSGGRDQGGRGSGGLGFDGIGGGSGRYGGGGGGLGFGDSSTMLTGFGHYGNQDGLDNHSRARMGLDHSQHGGGLGTGGLSDTSGELGSRFGRKGAGQDDFDSSARNGGGSKTGLEDGGRDGKGSRGRSAWLGGRSRPGSSMKRPPSSLRQRGSKLDGRDKMLRNTDFERGARHGRGRGDGDSDDEDGSGNKKGGRRRRLTKDDGNDFDHERKGLKSAKGRRRYRLGLDGDEDDEEEGSQFDLGNLRRFKSKRDNMRALKCTLKELQGIDPLDYLAKYCIIDQTKVPNYQRVFENVDRDEDDELTIPELDFALKAVNNNLISDAEMTYVHTILELAGRYALNFRLFCLVAALSERVVSLDAMVKRLINTMDFEALEVKMKKCKELFYLLADSNDHEGVVTAAALAVELQAGGLTEEHVDFVVNRLNREQRGIIEFLDYLTYVPLFVEIHDTISGNPLNFSRTK